MVSVGIAARRRRRARASGCGRARRGIRPRRAGGQSRPSRDANRGRVVGVLKPNSRHVDRTSHSYTRGVWRSAPRTTGRREAASTRAPARSRRGLHITRPAAAARAAHAGAGVDGRRRRLAAHALRRGEVVAERRRQPAAPEEAAAARRRDRRNRRRARRVRLAGGARKNETVKMLYGAVSLCT